MDALTVLSIWYTDSGLKTFEAYTLNREWMGQKLRQEASKRRMRLLIVIEAASFRGSTTFTASTFLFLNRKLCLS